MFINNIMINVIAGNDVSRFTIGIRREVNAKKNKNRG